MINNIIASIILAVILISCFPLSRHGGLYAQIDTNTYKLKWDANKGLYNLLINKEAMSGKDAESLGAMLVYTINPGMIWHDTLWILDTAGILARIDTLKMRVELIKGGTTKRFTTITEAIDSAVYGDVIKLNGGIYDEDVNMNKDSLIIVGTSKEKTILKSLTIRGQCCKVKNIHIQGDMNIYVVRANIDYWGEGIVFDNCFFSGNMNIGKADSITTQRINIRNCSIYSHEKYINIYNSEWPTTYFVNCNINSSDDGSINVPDTTAPTIRVYAGVVHFDGSTSILIDSIILDNSLHTVGIGINNCPEFGIGSEIVTSGGVANGAVIVMNNSTISFYGQTLHPNWIIGGACELDVFYCKLFRPEIIFNSTSISRWHYNLEKGWGTSGEHTISGTGLSHLYIYNSIFGCDTIIGLGADVQNIWNALTDD